MVLVDGQSPMNWPTKPRSDRARAILIGISLGRSISGIESSFLMNFGMAGAIGAAPRGRSSRLKASVVGEEEGGGSPPSGEAMIEEEGPGRRQRARPGSTASQLQSQAVRPASVYSLSWFLCYMVKSLQIDTLRWTWVFKKKNYPDHVIFIRLHKS